MKQKPTDTTGNPPAVSPKRAVRGGLASMYRAALELLAGDYLGRAACTHRGQLESLGIDIGMLMQDLEELKHKARTLRDAADNIRDEDDYSQFCNHMATLHHAARALDGI